MGRHGQLRAMADELVQLWEVAPPPFTARSLCGGPDKLHRKQLKAVLDAARYIILLCSRRAGKTVGILNRFLLRCAKKPSNCVYIALTKDQARSIAWEPAVGVGWKQLLRKYYGEESDSWHNETRMVTTFPNGSKVRFTGCSDVKRIETELGSSIDEVVVDESQSSPRSVLGPLVTRILPNCLTDRRGTMILAGTIPETDGGLFMEIWKNSKWAKHNWSQMENPHMVDPMGELLEYLQMNPGLTMESPIIQRERFGHFVYDKNATAYTYDTGLNGYRPTLLPWTDSIMDPKGGIRLPKNDNSEAEGRLFVPSGLMMAAAPLPWVEWIAFALDPAADSDRVSLQGIGWGRDTRRVQHLFDWTSDQAMKHTTSEMFAVAGLVRKMYGKDGSGHAIVTMRYDASGAKNIIDNLMRDFGIPLIIPAKKGSLKDGVDRVNTLLTEARLMVMMGSCWEEDCQKARRDPDAWARGQFKWASSWHPDASEAGRYALESYFDAFKAAPPPAPAKTPYDEYLAREAAKKASGAGRRGFKVNKGPRRAFS